MIKTIPIISSIWVSYGIGKYKKNFCEIHYKTDIILLGRWNRKYRFFKLKIKTADGNNKYLYCIDQPYTNEILSNRKHNATRS